MLEMLEMLETGLGIEDGICDGGSAGLTTTDARGKECVFRYLNMCMES